MKLLGLVEPCHRPRLLGPKRFRFPPCGKFTKCSLLARQIWSLLVLARINALLLACSQRLFDTPSVASCNSVCSSRVHSSLPGLHGVNLKELQVTWNHYEGARIQHTYILINPFSENTMRDELFTTFETYTVSPVFKLQQTKYDACWAATISMVNIRTHKVTLIITPSVKKI